MTEQRIGLQNLSRLISANGHTDMVDILVGDTLLTFSWQDIDTLLNCQQQWWSVFYQIGLFDVRDTCIRAGFQSRHLPITRQEHDEA